MSLKLLRNQFRAHYSYRETNFAARHVLFSCRGDSHPERIRFGHVGSVHIAALQHSLAVKLQPCWPRGLRRPPPRTWAAS